MKTRFLQFLGWFVSLTGYAQPSTEVYTGTLSPTAHGWTVVQLTNLSQNPGYDNQPSFWTKNVLLYASTRGNQTDIVYHALDGGNKQWKSHTPQGSEYSPLRIPSTEEFSAIRLDSTGLQRLYRYDSNGVSQLIHPTLKIGYHVWVNATTLLCTVLVDDRMDLYRLEVPTKKATLLQRQVGRSLHHIPGTSDFSFIHWKDQQAIVTRIDAEMQVQNALFTLPPGVQDHAWLPNGALIYGEGQKLYSVQPNQSPRVLKEFSPKEIQSISRIAISPNGQRIALVGEEIKL